MRLIEEIEADIRQGEAITDDAEKWAGYVLRFGKHWPRLRAALLAGEEMRQLLWDARAPQTASPEMWLSLRTLADNRFRAATEGENAAAIGRAS